MIIRHFDTLLGLMRQGALSYDLAHRAMHALENRALWFSQELFDPGDDTEAETDVSTMLEQLADQLHYIVEMTVVIRHDDADSALGWCDDQYEFTFALDLILDGLERLRETG